MDEPVGANQLPHFLTYVVLRRDERGNADDPRIIQQFSNFCGTPKILRSLVCRG